ncbi:MAG TPA: hypothetical protein VEY68_02060 [Anoxybacillus sp.]|jgi:hypothetical protein|nr:hypothetical protein [Anoxybacillus sp.]
MKKQEDKSVITKESLERNDVTTEDETAMAEFSINAVFYANDTHSDALPTYINNNTPAIKISK